MPTAVGVCAFDQAYDAVFVGTPGGAVRRRVQVAPDVKPETLTLLPVDVERSFQGRDLGRVFLYVLPDEATPTPGARYLVFAHRLAARADVLRLASFIRADRAETLVQPLEQHAAAPADAVVYGRLVQDLGDGRTVVPLAGVTIRMAGQGTSTDVVTASDGSYVGTGFDEGLVWVEPQLPDELWAPRRGVPVTRGGCVAHNITATLNGRVRGRVRRHDGTPYTWMVDLVRIDGSDGPRRQDTRADEGGAFAFAGQAPGEYLVGVNLDAHPLRQDDQSYYPGTPIASEALAITLGPSGVRDGLEWQLPPPVPSGELFVGVEAPGRSGERGVCVAGLKGSAPVGGGYYRIGAQERGIAIPVLEGRRYRLVAHVEGPAGHATSAAVEISGQAQRQQVALVADQPEAPHSENDSCGQHFRGPRPQIPMRP